MNYKAFKRLVVEIIPEATETVSLGGIHLPESAQKHSPHAKGKVISGFFLREGEAPKDRINGDGNAFIEPGDTILFSKSAPNENQRTYFLDEVHVLAIVED